MIEPATAGPSEIDGGCEETQASTPDSALKKLELDVKTLELQTSDPQKYGPFLRNSQGVVHNPDTGLPIVDQHAAALLTVDLELAQANVKQYIATLPDATVATSTSVNPALGAA
jgi:hypothetical protein